MKNVMTHKMTREEVFGCMRGQFEITDDFDAPLEDFKEYMEPHDSTLPLEKKAVRPPMQYGCLAGQIWMAEDFDAPLDDFKEYME